MNLRDLQYLVALADHRHFSRAAQACFVSQPTLSTQIRKLEEELGVTLFERAPRRVLLTDVGQTIVRRARTVLDDVEQIRQVARRVADPEAGRLTLGVFPTLGPYLLPHAMPAIKRRFPALELLLIEEKTEVLLTRLQEGRLDCALLALPIDDAQLAVRPLFDEPFVLAVPADHEFASRATVRLGDLAGERLLLLEDGHCLRNQALDVCELAGAAEVDDFRATSLETLRQMVAAGNGLTLLPQLSVTPPVAPVETMRLIPFESPAPSRQIGLVARRSSAVGPFLDLLAETLRDLPASLPK